MATSNPTPSDQSSVQQLRDQRDQETDPARLADLDARIADAEQQAQSGQAQSGQSQSGQSQQ